MSGESMFAYNSSLLTCTHFPCQSQLDNRLSGTELSHVMSSQDVRLLIVASQEFISSHISPVRLFLFEVYSEVNILC